MTLSVIPPPLLVELFPLMELFEMVNIPLLIRMPPPWLEVPFVTVRPANDTEAPLRTSNTLSIAPPLIVVLPIPAPAKDMLARTSKSPFALLSSEAPEMASVYVPRGSVRVSSPLPAAHSPPVAPDDVSVLADVIASRNEHRPSSDTTSVVVFTMIVAAYVGHVPSSGVRVRHRVAVV